ncbi:FAD-dependent oxidoreductase [Nocardia terpenica]|uniref:FAD-dependent oxidoreductase n=1 Tax=Nocardia terpenica TaxID=455432 RepID=A0A6G9Z4R9_9NOCA|nr:FAD-dependent oxidoreductase [Nocardia terpenica]QIS20176.1 FAD-dependent oxidoreductase [Nocardia terpenica]
MTEKAPDYDVPVLIVGGGVTGLSAALFLARQGVRPLLVERHPSTAVQPQARAFNPRTIEIYRALGLEDEIRGRASFLADLPEMLGARTLAGEERFRVNVLDQVRPSATVSPTDWVMIDQDELERIVAEHAGRAGADIRFGAELISFAEETDGVSALIRPVDGSAEYRVRARYLIAADGNRAGIRERLGIGASGPVSDVLMNVVGFTFDADLDAVLRGRRFLLAYFDEPVVGTTLVPMRQPGRWSMGLPYRVEDGETLADFTEERCVEIVRRAIGVADLDVTLRQAYPWSPEKVVGTRIGAWVADRYRVGRVFFAGDAAHVLPPTGSFGASTGIADAHNLAWKLAAVLADSAGEPLLDSYEAERRPVARVTLDQALQRLAGRHRGGGDDGVTIDDVTMIFGYRYDSAAVLTESPAPEGPVVDPGSAGGRPGLRTPHVWLSRAGEHVSTIDLFDGVWTLLVAPGGGEWVEAAEKAAVAAGIELRIHRIGTDLEDVDGRWSEAYGVTDTGVTLVRPDGFVAWRAVGSTPEPEGELRRVLARLLAR